jgi:hypothetical protein
MMLVLGKRNAVTLGVEEPPIPLEGGFGRALKHNAEKLCAAPQTALSGLRPA